MERSCLLYKLYNIKDVQLLKVNTVKTVYKGQSQGITKVASVDRWPLFGASETTFRCSRNELRLAFVDRKPLHAGVLMHRFDCRKPIQFIQFMLTRLYGKHNISYNVVVNTNTVNKQANTYTLFNILEESLHWVWARVSFLPQTIKRPSDMCARKKWPACGHPRDARMLPSVLATLTRDF